MGQQFYVIRNNPAPGTEAFKAKQERDRKKAELAGTGGADSADPATGTTATETVIEAERRPAQRQQPKRQTKSQRKGGGTTPVGNQRSQNQKRNGKKP
jgi:YidC/Oxa1 family membrane protein insertase